MKTNFFNLRRISALLAIIIAIVPFGTLQATEYAFKTDLVSFSDGLSLLNHFEKPYGLSYMFKNISPALDQSMQNLLDGPNGAFEKSLSVVRGGGVSAIEAKNAFNTYVTAATTYLENSEPSVAEVTNMMVRASDVMAVVLDGLDEPWAADVFESHVDPITEYTFTKEGITPAEYTPNVFGNLLQKLNLDLVAANARTNKSRTTKHEDNSNQDKICSAGQALGLNSDVKTCPRFETMMANATNLAGKKCSNLGTTDQQVACTVAWYNAQQALLKSVGDNITAISTAATTAKIDIAASQKTAIASIQKTTNAALSDITTAVTIGVAAINSDYRVLATLRTKSHDKVIADVSQINSNVFAKEVASLNIKLTTALDFTDFPVYPTGGLTVASAAGLAHSSSVPGKAVIALGAAQSAITGPINKANSAATALNAAVSKVKGAIDADSASAIKAINNVTTIAASNAAAQTGISTVNGDYTAVMGTKSAPGSVSQAITAAQSAKAALVTLQKTYTKLADIGTALKAVNAALNAANTAFPAGLPVLSSKNVSQYKASYPGGAVQKIINAQSAKNKVISSTNKTATSSTDTLAIIAALAGTFVGAMVLIGGGTALYKRFGKTPQEAADDIEPAAKEAVGKMTPKELEGAEVEMTEITKKAGVSKDASATEIAEGLEENGISVAEVTADAPNLMAAATDAASDSDLVKNIGKMVAGVDTDAELAPAEEEGIFDLIDSQSDMPIDGQSDVSFESFFKAGEALDQLETVESANPGVTSIDIINAAGDMPEEFTGSMVKKVEFVEKTLKENPDLVKNDGSIDMEEFKAKAQVEMEAPTGSTGPSNSTGSSDSTGQADGPTDSTDLSGPKGPKGPSGPTDSTGQADGPTGPKIGSGTGQSELQKTTMDKLGMTQSEQSLLSESVEDLDAGALETRIAALEDLQDKIEKTNVSEDDAADKKAALEEVETQLEEANSAEASEGL